MSTPRENVARERRAAGSGGNVRVRRASLRGKEDNKRPQIKLETTECPASSSGVALFCTREIYMRAESFFSLEIPA